MQGRDLTIHIRGSRDSARFKALIRLRRNPVSQFDKSSLYDFVERLQLVLDDSGLEFVEKITVVTPIVSDDPG